MSVQGQGKITRTELSKTLTDELDDMSKYSVYNSNKDANSIYTTVQLNRSSNGTLYVISVLSGGTSPNYTTRTETYYKTDGTTVDVVKTYTRTYDTDGDLSSEVMN